MAPKKKGAADKGKGKVSGAGDGERPKWISAELWALCSNMPALVAALGGGDAAKAPSGVTRAEVSWRQGAKALAPHCMRCLTQLAGAQPRPVQGSQHRLVHHHLRCVCMQPAALQPPAQAPPVLLPHPLLPQCVRPHQLPLC